MKPDNSSAGPKEPEEKKGSATDSITVDALLVDEMSVTGSFDLRGFRTSALAKLLNVLPLPAVLLDNRQSLVFLNEAGKLLIPDHEQYVGRNITTLIPYPDHAQLARTLLDRIRVEKGLQVHELAMGTSENLIRARVRLRSLRVGRDRMFLMLVEDLTNEKKQYRLIKDQEEKLRAAQETLEQKVQERTSDLLLTNEHLKEEVVLRRRAQMKYRAIFETVPVAILEEDFSVLKTAIDDLKSRGTTDFKEYLRSNPDFVSRAVKLIRIADVNEAAVKLFGAEKKQQLLGSASKILVPESLPAFKDQLIAIAEGRTYFEAETVNRTLGGELIDIFLRLIIPPENSAFRNILITKMDITERKKTEAALGRAKVEWERTFDAVPDLISIIDTQNRILRINKAMADKVGMRSEDVVGKFCYELFHEAQTPPVKCPHRALLKDGNEHIAEIVEKKWDGYFLVSVTPLTNANGELIGCVHVARDITQRKKLEEDLQYHATRDSLTNLYNRRQFLELLKTECISAQRYGTPLSLAICDLDDFKSINDRYGHLFGDQALTAFAQILAKQLRGSDFAGRFGGDEFVVAFPHTTAEGAAESMERVRSILEDYTFLESNNGMRATCTVGIAEFGPDANSTQALIHAADSALYEAKALGRNRVVVSTVPAARQLQ
jgi:diguanylate cyclase (GGDEF)-like protein/PAS domain S-box-containing protein